MANLPISGLTASAANLASTDVAPVVQTTGIGPVKMTGLQLAGGLLGSATFNGATVTTSQPVLNLSQTWNAGAVTFTGLKFNVTDTASASGSLLLDLQVGGTTIFNVSKASNAYTNTKNGGFAYLAGNSSGVLIGRSNNDGTNGIFAGSGTSIGFTNASGDTGTIDVRLTRGGTATLQLGAADVATGAVAQFLQVQSNTGAQNGPNFTIKGSNSGAGNSGGSIIFQTATAGAYATALTLGANGNATFAANAAVTGNLNSSYFALTPTGYTNAAILYNTGANIALSLTSNGIINWSENATNAGSGTAANAVILARDAANTLALRNGLNAQTFRVYNTYTDASNWEALALTWSANVAYIYPAISGAGTQRNLFVGGTTGKGASFIPGSNLIELSPSGSIAYSFAAGNLSLGWVGGANSITLAPQTGNNNRNSDFLRLDVDNGTGSGNAGYFVVRSAVAGTTGTSSHTLEETLRSYVLTTAQPMLSLGGVTSSFPALKRSGAGLVCRLADDSANAAFEALSLKTGAPTGGTSGTWKVGVYNATAPSATGYVEVDIGGTLYKLLAST